MRAGEDEHLEFKEARNNFHFETLVDYCAALANEGGGRMILGVTDRRPRRVVGSAVFPNLVQTRAAITERLRLRIDAFEIAHPNGRVVVLEIPSRPIGVPIQYRGAYKMRRGDQLTDMTPDLLKRIFDEARPDFSAEACSGASLSDLDPVAIQRLREMWHRKSGNGALLHMPDDQLLDDAELIVDGGVTYAALVLLGTRQALGRYLGQAEVIFEYRSSEASLPAQDRAEYRQGFFLYVDDLWSRINLRNDRQSYQLELVRLEVQTFNEVAVRELLLNAVGHRDYRRPESIFVRQFPRKLEIVSPGGFLPGITPENILWKQAPRNRRIAEVFAKCGLVERSGQGMNRIFETAIKESKPWPDFLGTDEHQVLVTLHGEVQDERFLRFIELIGRERLTAFTTRDLLLIDLIHREQQIPDDLRSRLPFLIEHGVIEAIGLGRGRRYMLARHFYQLVSERGAYTRKQGLDRETNQELLLKHMRDSRAEGSRLEELMQVLPSLSRGQVQALLRALRAAGRIHNVGRTRSSLWYPGPTPSGIAEGTNAEAIGKQ